MAKKKSSTALVHLEFGDFTMEDAEEEQKAAEAATGGGKILKLKPGKTVLRVVPPLKGQKLFRVAYVHYLDIPGVGRVSFNCPRLMAKRPCATCTTEQKLLATGQDIDYRKARKLKAKRQVFINVIERADEERGPRPFRFGKTIEDNLTEIRQDEDDGGNFSHPIEGFDLKFIRKGEGANDTEYKVTVTGPMPKLLHEDEAVMREWIENQPDLSRYLRVLTDEQIEKKLRGEDINDDDEDEDDEPRGRRRASKSVDEEIEDIEVDDIPY